MEHVRWASRPVLTEPVLIAAFEGWNDAGDAASTAARYLAERWDATLVAEIDPEEFLDFSTTRPQVQLDDDGHREIVWPTTEVLAATLPGGERDAVFVLGQEPQLKWRTYCSEIVAIAEELGAGTCITLGALLAEVPHTRPTPVVGTAYDLDTIGGVELRPSSYEGPTGIVGVLHDAARTAGLRTASLWATVPSYVPGAPSPKAALALIERIGEVLDLSLTTTDLEIASVDYERQIDQLVNEDDETAGYVANLEARYDSGEADEDDLTDASALVEEVERFLREQ